VAKTVDAGVLVDLYGGRFRMTSIIQKRLRELVRGARPLVEVPRGRKDLIDIVMRELEEGKIEPTEGLSEPTGADIFQGVVDSEETEDAGTADEGDEAE